MRVTKAEIQHERGLEPALTAEEARGRAISRKELDVTGQVFVRIKGARHLLVRDELGNVSVTPCPGD